MSIPIESDANLPRGTVLFINTKLSAEDRAATEGMDLEAFVRWMVENRKLTVAVNVGPPDESHGV